MFRSWKIFSLLSVEWEDTTIWLELLEGQSLQPDMSGPYDHHVFVLTSLQVNKSDEEHQQQLYDQPDAHKHHVYLYMLIQQQKADRFAFL